MVYECHVTVDARARLLVDQRRAEPAQQRELRRQVGDAEREMVHALAATGEEAPDRCVVAERRQQLDAAGLPEQQREGFHALFLDALARLDPRAVEALVAGAGVLEVADGDADVVDAERGHARIVPWPRPRGSSDAIMQAHAPPTGRRHGPVRQGQGKGDRRSRAGKEAAQAQQLKLQLRKLEGEVETAPAALGAAAYDQIEAGTLAAGGALDALVAQVREARAAVEAKKAEVANAGTTTATTITASTATATTERMSPARAG